MTRAWIFADNYAIANDGRMSDMNNMIGPKWQNTDIYVWPGDCRQNDPDDPAAAYAGLIARLLTPRGISPFDRQRVLPCVGNHDQPRSAFSAAFNIPTDPWYVEIIDGARWIVLDSMDADVTGWEPGVTPRQLTWLNSVLATAHLGPTFAVMHHPRKSSNKRTSPNTYNNNTVLDSLYSALDGHADVIFVGHSGAFEITKKIDSTWKPNSAGWRQTQTSTGTWAHISSGDVIDSLMDASDGSGTTIDGRVLSDSGGGNFGATLLEWSGTEYSIKYFSMNDGVERYALPPQPVNNPTTTPPTGGGNTSMSTFKAATQGTYVGGTATTSLPTHVSGDLLLACVSRHGPSHNPAGSYGLSSLDGWTQIYDTAGASYGPKLTGAYKFATSSSETAPTFAFTGNVSGSWHVLSISGADPTSPVDFLSGQQNGSSTTMSIAGGTTTVNGVLAVAFAAFNNNNSQPSTGSYAERSDVANQQYNAGVVGTKDAGNAGAFGSDNWSNVAANAWTSITVGIRPNVGVSTTAALSNPSISNGTIEGSGPSNDPGNVDPANSMLTAPNVSDNMEWDVNLGASLNAVPFNLVLDVAVGPAGAFPDTASGVLTARLFKSNGTTPLTDIVEVAAISDASASDGVYSIDLTNPDQAASLAEWRGLTKLKLNWALS